ncbi:MAG: hypothetical protein ACM3YE_01370 [Bacteroidota bacterium]
MIKQISVLLIVGSLFLFATTESLANSGLVISFQERDQTGFFDYILYYPYSSQVISKVSLPQDQLIKIINLKYHFTNKKDFIRLQYGGTGVKFKGEGSDSDWTIVGSDIVTDYGVFSTYGEQKVAAVEFGKAIIGNEIQQVDLVIGLVRQETANELKNIVYHLIDGENVGAQTQPDNGSYLDGEFSGLVAGVNHALTLGKKLILTNELNISFLSAKAYGHWANYTPAWNWENRGRTVSYGATIGLRYNLNDKVQAELGYIYSYAKFTGCRETLNGDLVVQKVDLEYERKGLHLGLVLLF